MKLFSVFKPCGINLRFVAVLVICCTILKQISATDDTLEGQRRGAEQNFNGVSADAGETGELKQSLLYRERRASNTNATPNLQDFEKRLKAMEQRFQNLLSLLPRSSDSLYASLFGYILGQHGQNGGKNRGGPPGPPGKPGPTGRTGSKGEPGQAGKTGFKGETGLTGAKGEPGKPGTNKPFLGPAGPKGDQGAVGKTGAQGPRGAKGEKGQSGVKYVRWGRTTCPSGAQIVYKGLIGGEWYNNPGGGANYLCLPHNPKYDKFKNGRQAAGYISGSEYQVNQYSGDPFKRNIHDHEAPCVVCFVKSRGSMLMMPARNDCPSGWTEEYHGYLMTEYHGHRHSRDFICVDGDPEYVPGTHVNHDGALLYPVEGVCGSLPCRPYVAGRELTCAVCTK